MELGGDAAQAVRMTPSWHAHDAVIRTSLREDWCMGTRTQRRGRKIGRGRAAWRRFDVCPTPALPPPPHAVKARTAPTKASRELKISRAIKMARSSERHGHPCYRPCCLGDRHSLHAYPR